MSEFTLSDFSVARGPCDVLRDIDLTVGAGEFVGLLGPNGAGKTTLMRAALGMMPHRGRSTLSALPVAERARRAAWLPQAREIGWPISVEDVVTLGRLPHLARGQKPGGADRAAIDKALARMGLEGFRTRIATQLSGGEQARVLIARALAQDTPLLMADEPAAGLDPAHQLGLMDTLAAEAARGRSVIASLHDLGLAARYCTRLVVLWQGGIAADGPPQEVLTPDLLARVFQIRAYVRQTDDGPICQPLGVV
ncbi:Fe(3+) dicitrate transport ATP-binding protein FecE [Roseibaca ekhonensis]|uniref:Fe(3+) dicitrate transport ATP-binding protein FecE n=1 Tax=Roseinatronobacter ekhonensis TaxID=254356 RepID=A0A3B0M430_9RHOB|nr:ABC transporter ATP-binding protein [Roseibaca ekhonensis]SUZ30553.1 Fe(3+) dicitrate transport ATP-binding protein FecE [Roseibaca ekhonensis]